MGTLSATQTESGSVEVTNLSGSVVAEFPDLTLDTSEFGQADLKVKIAEATSMSSFQLAVNVAGSGETPSWSSSVYQAKSNPPPAQSAVPAAPSVTYTFSELKDGCPTGVEL